MLYCSPRGRLLLSLGVLLLALMVNEQKGHEHDAGADPVQPARVLRVLDHLADEREGDVQGQADGDDERGGEQHGVGPEDVAAEGGG